MESLDTLSLILALLGALVLGLGLPSRWLDQRPIPLALLSLLIGILVGPAGLGLLDLEALAPRSEIMERVARIVLGIGLVAIALEVPRSYPRQNWRGLIVLIGGGMPLMWASNTLLLLLILDLPLWLAAMIGAAITPTDPIAAAPVVTGRVAEKYLPPRVRHAIAFESGANDGLSYLFVFIPFLALTRPADEAIRHWLLHTLVWQVLVASAVGIALGLGSARLLRAAEARDLIEEDWRLVHTVSLSVLAVGLGRLMGSDELLVAFAAGAAFVQIISEEDRAEEELGQEAVNRFFSLPVFALIGILIPWQGWADLGWRGALLALSVLLLRRIPGILAIRRWIGDVGRFPDALFIGWFGPIAAAALYYVGLMETLLHERGMEQPILWDVVSMVICASVVVHGISSVPLTRLYGRVANDQTELTLERS
jgi:sodium/hydrogen antiporter